MQELAQLALLLLPQSLQLVQGGAAAQLQLLEQQSQGGLSCADSMSKVLVGRQLACVAFGLRLLLVLLLWL